jgi:hypothetical protein
MTKEEYNKIRTSNEFLFEYYLQEKGQNIGPDAFNELLDVWLMTRVGVHPAFGRDTIVRHLDQMQRN